MRAVSFVPIRQVRFSPPLACDLHPVRPAEIVAVQDAEARVARAHPRCPDAELVRREITQAIAMARHGAWRIARHAGFECPKDAEMRDDLRACIEEQRACWLERSRPGGLEDSVARLRPALESYE